MDKKVSETGARRRGIQSVEIGLKVLQAVNALGTPSTLTAVSQACGMPASQVHRYLHSLIASGMAEQDASTGRYDLGPSALMFGLAALARSDPFQLVDRFIKDYALRTSRTVQIAALGPFGPTVVRWYSGMPVIATSFSVGSVLSILHSATGRVFFAFAPPAETAALVRKEVRRAPIARAELDALGEQIRRKGSARVEGSVIPGLSAVAFPIFDLQGRVRLSATLLWPEALRAHDQDAAIEELSAICVEISAKLGWPGHGQS